MEIWNDTQQAVNPYQLAIASSVSRRGSRTLNLPPVVRPALLTQQLRGMDGCACGVPGMAHYEHVAGLGYVDISTGTHVGTGNMSIIGAVEMGLNTVPVVGQIASGVMTAVHTILNFFGGWIGSGRIEADAIVPSQNTMMNRLGEITQGFLIGRSPSLTQLQEWYREVWQLGVGFMEFVLLQQFTDRRASGQALNTVMPYIDGTCGYAEPLGVDAYATQANCLSWGDGTLGGVGTDGMMGALARAIQNWGGTVPSVPTDITTAANNGFEVPTGPPPPDPCSQYPVPSWCYPPPPPPTTAGAATMLPVILGGLSLLMLARRMRG